MRRLCLVVVLVAAFGRPALGQFNLPQGPGALPALPNGPAQQPAQQPSPVPAKMSIIDPRGVEVRSGPTMEYFVTSRLKYGDVVTVVRESKDQPGWYAIVPPPGSFSWIDSKYVKPVDNWTGYVEGEGNGAVPVRPGSSIINKEPNHESVKIPSGFIVTLSGRPNEVNGSKWIPIVPPPSEFRFIPKEAVQRAQTESVTPPSWLRSGTNGPTPGQLTANPNSGSVGTPASFSQWSQHNGVTTQPPQWSQWGKLRRTAHEKDGQKMYLLEDRQGRPLMYVTTVPGTSLGGYVDQTVCLYGAISYRSDGYQRTHYIVASHVATP